MNIYRLRATCLCPHKPNRDHYDVEIRADRTILVEDILEFFNDHANEKLYQEELTAKAQLLFNADVTLIGPHPAGVTVETT